MDLNELVEQDSGAVRGWVTFVEGFDVDLEYIGKQRLQEITRKCTKTFYRNHQPVEEVDSKKLTREVARFIKGWRGMDGEMVARFFPVKDGVDLDGLEVPCTEENRIYMLNYAYGFDDFIMKAITQIQVIRAERLEGEIKNSEALSQES